MLKPIGTGGVSGNYGRFNSPEATEALKAYANADRRRGPHRRAEHAAEDHGRADADDPDVGADNVGGAYSTKNWVGWPDEPNPYAPAQPTQPNALDVVLNLKPAGSLIAGTALARSAPADRGGGARRS